MKALIPLIIGLSIPVVLFVIFDRLAAHPMRWLTRGRMLLIAINAALDRGAPIERALVELAEKRDPELGPQFHALAAWLQEGLPLHDALSRTPDLLPRPIHTLLVEGSRSGTLAALLPVARDIMQSLASPLRPAGRNLIAPLTVMFCLIGVTAFFSAFIAPRLTMILSDMGAGATVFPRQGLWFAGHVVVLNLMVAANLFLMGGPAVTHWARLRLPRLTEAVHRCFPWQLLDQRRRFGLMLAHGLDAKIPEAEALRMAGEFADNRWFQAKVERAIAALRDGEGLDEALRRIDPDPDYRFRLEAARRSGGALREALDGWAEALDARARFREAAVIDVVYTAFLGYSAACVGMIGVSFFSAEVRLIETLVTW